ncbi:hypothetical protein BJ742DRAFT_910986 [Cladochytrium replicatum]|nr:hypothetical protein BJ742DRAFT_910986 [Cladochytrium replicatum]
MDILYGTCFVVYKAAVFPNSFSTVHALSAVADQGWFDCARERRYANGSIEMMPSALGERGDTIWRRAIQMDCAVRSTTGRIQAEIEALRTLFCISQALFLGGIWVIGLYMWDGQSSVEKPRVKRWGALLRISAAVAFIVNVVISTVLLNSIISYVGIFDLATAFFLVIFMIRLSLILRQILHGVRRRIVQGSYDDDRQMRIWVRNLHLITLTLLLLFLLRAAASAMMISLYFEMQGQCAEDINLINVLHALNTSLTSTTFLCLKFAGRDLLFLSAELRASFPNGVRSIFSQDEVDRDDPDAVKTFKKKTASKKPLKRNDEMKAAADPLYRNPESTFDNGSLARQQEQKQQHLLQEAQHHSRCDASTPGREVNYSIVSNTTAVVASTRLQSIQESSGPPTTYSSGPDVYVNNIVDVATILEAQKRVATIINARQASVTSNNSSTLARGRMHSEQETTSKRNGREMVVDISLAKALGRTPIGSKSQPSLSPSNRF